jgi:hypothetical protein
MRDRYYALPILAPLLCVFALSALPVATGAQPAVGAGWLLLQTDPTQSVSGGLGAILVGDPLGTYNFGGAIGVQNVGAADTVIDIQGPGTTGPSNTAVVNIQLDALQLQTTRMYGSTRVYFTLDPSQPSTSTMDMTFNSQETGGTFTSSLNMFVDIRVGSIDGPLPGTGGGLMSSGACTWSRTAPAGSQQVSGVNLDLDGIDNAADFWPTGLVAYTDGNGTSLVDLVAADPPTSGAGVASIPEFPSAAFATLGSLGMLHSLYRRRRDARSFAAG